MVDEKAFGRACAVAATLPGSRAFSQKSLRAACEAYEAARTAPEQTRAWAQDDLDAATDSVWDELNDRGVLSGKASKQAVRIALRALAPVAPPEQATAAVASRRVVGRPVVAAHKAYEDNRCLGHTTALMAALDAYEEEHGAKSAAVAPGDLDEKAMQAALGAVADFHGDDDIRIARAISAYLQATAAVAPGELTRDEELERRCWLLVKAYDCDEGEEAVAEQVYLLKAQLEGRGGDSEAQPRNAQTHFNGLSPTVAELLALLSEECGEVVQVVGKCLRHGTSSYHPSTSGRPTNAELLEKELGDVLAATLLLGVTVRLDLHEVQLAAERKLSRVGQYLHHASADDVTRAKDLITTRDSFAGVGQRSVDKLAELIAERDQLKRELEEAKTGSSHLGMIEALQKDVHGANVELNQIHAQCHAVGATGKTALDAVRCILSKLEEAGASLAGNAEVISEQSSALVSRSQEIERLKEATCDYCGLRAEKAEAELAALKARHEALVSKIEAREKQFRSCNQEGEYLHAAECLKYDLRELTALKQTEQPSNPAPAAPQVHEGPLALLSRRVDAVSLLLRELVPAFWTLEHLEAERPDMLAAFKALEQKP